MCTFAHVRLPKPIPPTPQSYDFDVLISQGVGPPATGSSVRIQPTGGSEWQVVILAEALARHGLSVGIVGPYFAYAVDRGVTYVPLCEVVGRPDAYGNHRPSSKLRTKVLVSERFGQLPVNVEFERVVFDLHDIPDHRLSSVIGAMQSIPDSAVVAHSEFTRSLLDGWPRVSVIPCMLPDEFYAERPKPVKLNDRAHRYVYGSAAMKGLEPTLELWKQLKREKGYHWKKATLVITSPGYDQINPALLEGCRDVTIHHGLSPAGMQQLLEASDGIFMASTFPETFGIVFHQCEIAGKPARVLQLHGNTDALHQTLSTPDTLFTDAEQFIDSFKQEITATPWDYRVSTILPKWLDVLGLAQPKQQENAA